MVDIDGNSTQPKQDSNRNSPKNENDENENVEIPQEEQQEEQQEENEEPPQPQPSDINEEEVPNDRPASPTGSTRSTRSQVSIPPAPEPFDKHLLISPPDTKIICLKCTEILREPVQIKACGHRLCLHCHEEIRSGSAPKCPDDQMDLEDKKPDIDKAFKREIDNLEVKCKNNGEGCKWEGTVQEFQKHTEECDYATMTCEHDCGATFQKRFKQKHIDKDCGKKIISCPYCDDRHLREDKKGHVDDCPKRPLTCPNKCDKKLILPRDELQKHIENECNRTKIMCEFEDVNCDHKASRDKMIKHYTKEITTHVKMLHDLLMKHDKLLSTVVETVGAHEVKFEKQDERIGDLERIANSQLIWRIDEYSKKMKAAQCGETTTLFSPCFITSKHGYRLSASVCLNGDGKGKGSHMSVFICILKGPYDALLRWPFDCRVTFTLLDQHEDPTERKHIKFSIKPNPTPENGQFLGRPFKMEKNASFGGAKFAKHDDIESRHYVIDDTLFVKINVDCEGHSEPY